MKFLKSQFDIFNLKELKSLSFTPNDEIHFKFYDDFESQGSFYFRPEFFELDPECNFSKYVFIKFTRFIKDEEKIIFDIQEIVEDFKSFLEMENENKPEA